jgi:FecR protein
MQRRNFSLSLLSFAFFAVLLTASFAVTARAGDNSYSYARIVRLSLVSGDVQIIRSDDAKWEPALMNMPIQQGMAVGTNDGRAEIEFENGGAIWLGENSLLQFTELALSNGGRITKLSLSQGTATFDPNLASSDSFLLVTPELQINSAAKSEFRADVRKDGSSLSVLAGHVSVSSLAGTKDLRKGETFAVNANTPTDAKVTSNLSPDDWDKWVKSRSSLLSDGQNQSLQYTNAPFSYGMADLSSYGGWSFYPGFGYGWQPYGVTNGWAPFTGGQWSFYPGLGWTWLSSEPWGWVPYHFGQWEYSPVYGWLWLPGGYGFWSPAPVQWFGLGNRIGWAPVNPVRLGAAHATTALPVVVASKDLGKGGANKVLSVEQAGEKLQSLSAAPLSNGKIGTPAELAALQSSAVEGAAPVGYHKALLPGEAQLVVPTAANLEALRSGVVFDSAQRRFASASPAILTGGKSLAPPLAFNGAPRALKMPASLPPIRTAMGPAIGPEAGGAMRASAPSLSRGTGATSSAISASHGTSKSR